MGQERILTHFSVESRNDLKVLRSLSDTPLKILQEGNGCFYLLLRYPFMSCFIYEFGASRKQINELLWNKLPIDYTEDQKVRKIGNLLTKLRKKGTIFTDENRQWHLSDI